MDNINDTISYSSNKSASIPSGSSLESKYRCTVFSYMAKVMVWVREKSHLLLVFMLEKATLEEHSASEVCWLHSDTKASIIILQT